MGKGGRSSSSRGASSRPSSHTPATPHTTTPHTTTKATPAPTTTPGAPPARPASTTAKPPAQHTQTHAPNTRPNAPAHQQQRNNTMGAMMRGAMIGMGAGLLSAIGLNYLFGGHGRPMEMSDLVAAGTGTATTIGTAMLYRNRHLFAKSSPLAIRPPLQYPRRPIVLGLVGALGGLMLNSMRLESNKQKQVELEQASAPPQPGYNQYGDEAPQETA
eukprot:Phypoly_transcript_08402.p1 GENE.Phypoly_transcript_08402~~Phypoly_transcript_08402.p1  ORF type:complete len:216 (+),score=52.22 Phypoly_transcript_08402:45-692(+)